MTDTAEHLGGSRIDFTNLTSRDEAEAGALAQVSSLMEPETMPFNPGSTEPFVSIGMIPEDASIAGSGIFSELVTSDKLGVVEQSGSSAGSFSLVGWIGSLGELMCEFIASGARADSVVVDSSEKVDTGSIKLVVSIDPFVSIWRVPKDALILGSESCLMLLTSVKQGVEQSSSSTSSLELVGWTGSGTQDIAEIPVVGTKLGSILADSGEVIAGSAGLENESSKQVRQAPGF